MISMIRPHPGRGTPWLISLVDLVGILLAFFVLLFAMTSLDRERLRTMLGTATVDGPPVAAERADRDAILGSTPMAELSDPGYFAAVLRQRFQAGAGAAVTVLATESGVRIDLAVVQAAVALAPIMDLLRRLPVQLTLRVAVPDPASEQDWRAALDEGNRVASELAAAGVGHAVEYAAVIEPDAAPLSLLVAIFDGAAP